MGYAHVEDKPYLRDESCLYCQYCEEVMSWRDGKRCQSRCSMKKTWGHMNRGKYCPKYVSKDERKSLSQKEAGQEPAGGSDPGAKLDMVGSKAGSACGNL